MNSLNPLLSAKSIEKDPVKNPQGEDIGNIKELMIDTENGRIEYAVLSFGGLMGIGDKLFAIPWEAISVDSNEHKLVINVQKEELKNAPGFDKDNWPNMADPAFRDNIRTYYKAYY